MKTKHLVKTLTLVITILCLFSTIFSTTVLKLKEKQYVAQKHINLKENHQTDLALDLVGIEEININQKIIVAEGVSQEELDKEARAAKLKEVVYEGMTLEELSNKLDKSLNSTLSNQGLTFATYATELGVDPYLAVAIALHETGCKWSCSGAVNNYNNVGGMMGKNGLLQFNSLDEGIKAFISNIYRNYTSQGLTTPEAMSSKYASSSTWASNVNSYINEIKAA